MSRGTKYKRGQSGNPNGRPKGSRNKYSVADIAHGIQAVEKKTGRTFIETWIRAAWGDAREMANVMSFMMPKLKAIEVSGTLLSGEMDDNTAKAIQAKIRARYEEQEQQEDWGLIRNGKGSKQ